MARSFNGTTDTALCGTSPISAMPCSFACWLKPSSATVDGYPIGLYNAAANGFLAGLSAGAVAGDPFQAQQQSNTGGNARASTSTGFTTGVWHHLLVVFNSTTDRRVYINGASKGTNTTSVTAPTLSRVGIGVRYLTTLSGYYAGDIAIPAMWNVALTDSDATTLAGGAYPTDIASGLVAYWALDGSSPEVDSIGGFDLTLSGTSHVADPPLGSSTPLGAFEHHFRMMGA